MKQAENTRQDRRATGGLRLAAGELVTDRGPAQSLLQSRRAGIASRNFSLTKKT